MRFFSFCGTPRLRVGGEDSIGFLGAGEDGGGVVDAVVVMQGNLDAARSHFLAKSGLGFSAVNIGVLVGVNRCGIGLCDELS